MRTRIDFKTDKGEFYVIRPTQQQTMDAELVYKTKYSEALRFGALTTSEALRIIEERDLWTEDDRDMVSKLLLEVHQLGMDLDKEESLSKGLELIARIEEKRMDVLRVNLKRNAVLDNTSESYADEQRLQYYITECSYKADGTKMFKNKTELINASDEESTVLATKFLIYLVANDGDDFRKDWPDYKWREKNGLIDENLEPVEDFSDDFKTKLDAEVKKAAAPKRKRTPRKKTTTKS